MQYQQSQSKFNYTEAYKLGQAGFAVLDVEVFLTEAALEARISNPSGATPEASGVVKIEEEVVNQKIASELQLNLYRILQEQLRIFLFPVFQLDTTDH